MKQIDSSPAEHTLSNRNLSIWAPRAELKFPQQFFHLSICLPPEIGSPHIFPIYPVNLTLPSFALWQWKKRKEPKGKADVGHVNDSEQLSGR